MTTTRDPKWSDIWPAPLPPQCPHDSPVTGVRCVRLRGHFGTHEAAGGMRWTTATIRWEK